MASDDEARSPGPVPIEVLKYWRSKGLKVGFDYRDVWNEEHEIAFTVAKVMREDVLEAFQSSIEDALVEGLPFDQWKKIIEPRLKELGWWETRYVEDPKTGKTTKVEPPHRLRTIFRTNMRTARAAGQQERIQRTKRSRPYLMYMLGPSARHRDAHVAWHGLTLPVDDDWWNTHTPPLGYNCRCRLRQLSKREYDRAIEDGVPAPSREPILDDEGLPTGHVVDRRIQPKTKAPEIKLVPWENKRTGEVELIPDGVQPGFHHRPGVARQLALEERGKKKKLE